MKFLACLLVLAIAPLLVVSAGADVKKNAKSVSVSSSSSISVNQSNDEAIVKYNGKEVWKGKVKKPVIAVSESENGNDLAAAFEGKKLLWENVAGAGKRLEDKRKEAAKRLKKLGGQ